MARFESGNFTLDITSWGPSPAQIHAATRSLLEQPEIIERFRDVRYRLLAFNLADARARDKSSRTALPPTRYQATFYDYTHQVTVQVQGSLDDPNKIEIDEFQTQPLPVRAEFEEAVSALRRDPQLGQALAEGRLQPYPPMPPLLPTELPDGRIERTLAVGLLPAGEVPAEGIRGAAHEIVGVNLATQEVLRYVEKAPRSALAARQTCGFPYADQPTVQHAAGAVRVTVSQGRTVLWRFIALRPAASSGTNGSGVELRQVDYRGRRVLARAHVPILNVQYAQNACGPYRDWQNEESMLMAPGIDVAPGFRFCPSGAQTVMETQHDRGDFAGVAIYVEGDEVVLVSEMEAGWYRYISQWRLGADGVIRPRFGFTAVNTSSCVCKTHYHHVYWRLDFDIQTVSNNLVSEYNDPPVAGNSNWDVKNFEVKRYRDPAHQRKWRVENAGNGNGYEIVPGAEDGTAQGDAFAQGDLWILRYRPSEFDDNVVAVGPPYEAGLDAWQNGENVLQKDVVIWYAGHFTHDTGGARHQSGHVLGPELRPYQW